VRTAKPVEYIAIHMLENPIQDATEGSPSAKEWLMARRFIKKKRAKFMSA
jgi:hypothetical protein